MYLQGTSVLAFFAEESNDKEKKVSWHWHQVALMDGQGAWWNSTG